jgi:hypothetical protein
MITEKDKREAEEYVLDRVNAVQWIESRDPTELFNHVIKMEAQIAAAKAELEKAITFRVKAFDDQRSYEFFMNGIDAALKALS